jgi:phosphatidylinositol glycan class N
VGKLPIKYLNLSEKDRAEALSINAQQIYNQYLRKEQVKRETEFFFKPFTFRNLEGVKMTPDQMLEEILNIYMQNGNYKTAEEEYRVFIEECLEGLRYLQTYDWLLLRSVISAGYLGWMVYSTIYVMKTYSTDQSRLSFDKIERVVVGGHRKNIIVRKSK